MFLNDELPSQWDHEQDAEPPAQQRQRKNAPEREFRAESEKDERRQREHHAGGQRFPGGAGGLHNVVFENRRAPERPQNADREHSNGNGSGNGQSRAQADVNAHRAKQQPEKRAEDHRTDREFLEAFFRRYVGAEFTCGSRGTPWPFANCCWFAH